MLIMKFTIQFVNFYNPNQALENNITEAFELLLHHLESSMQRVLHEGTHFHYQSGSNGYDAN